MELYLGGGEDDAPDRLRSCEHLNLLNDPGSLVNQSHSVEEPRLWKPDRDVSVRGILTRWVNLAIDSGIYRRLQLFSCRQSS